MDWIETNYDISKFKMNEVRRKQMKDVIDKLSSYAFMEKDHSMIRMYFEDNADVEDVLMFLEQGNIEMAVRKYSRCDTAARDKYPMWIAQLAGFKINPAFYNHKYSLEGTEV